MKKNVGWSLVLGLMALAGLQSCQLVAGSIEVAREVKDFPMEIKLHDGTVLAGEARMPNGGTRDVNLKLADGTKKEVESEDIAYLTAWNPKMPDSKFAMVYKDKKWMTPKAVGEHVAIFAYAADFFVGKDGTMTVSGTSMLSVRVKRKVRWCVLPIPVKSGHVRV